MFLLLGPIYVCFLYIILKRCTFNVHNYSCMLSYPANGYYVDCVVGRSVRWICFVQSLVCTPSDLVET